MKYAEKLMKEMVEGGCDEVTLNDPAGNWWKLTLTEELNCRVKKKSKHADLMLEYAKDAQDTDKPWERWEMSNPHSTANKDWHPCECQEDMFVDTSNYRRIDPYRHLKEAQERGEVIQRKSGDHWETKPGRPHIFNSAPDRYRIKPKEKKKLYLWAFKLPDDTEWGFDDNLHASEEDVRNSWPDYHEQVAKVIFKRIDSTMIEVDA